ncbi:MAG: glycerophosphodiester phosphodiesterase [Betaproteobacteria bacterium]|nr:glycerophosphodiester phosphodiesterase [Betaproteobacteria bacterium]
MTARNLDLLKAFPIAHRGFFDNAGRFPENSCGAIAEAVQLGFASELDVMLSADNEVMVFHDDSLERMGGNKTLFGDLGAKELQAFQLKQSVENIPTLAQVLAAVQGRRPLIIELKSFTRNGIQTDGRLEAQVAQLLSGYAGPVALKSFNPFSVAELMRIRKPSDTWPVGFISCNHAKDADFAFMTAEQMHGLSQLVEGIAPVCEFVSYNINDLTSELSQRIRARMPLMVWTVRTEEQFNKAKILADNVVFEWRGVLAERFV